MAIEDKHEYSEKSMEEYIRSLTPEQIAAVYKDNDDEAKSTGKFIGEEYGLATYENPFIVDGIEIGYPFNIRKAVDRFGKDIIPDCLGIYHLFFDEQLVYIGMSKNLRARLLCHISDEDKVFTHVLWFCADKWKPNATIADVMHIERVMIRKMKPVLNQIYTYKG